MSKGLSDAQKARDALLSPDFLMKVSRERAISAEDLDKIARHEAEMVRI